MTHVSESPYSKLFAIGQETHFKKVRYYPPNPKPLALALKVVDCCFHFYTLPGTLKDYLDVLYMNVRKKMKRLKMTALDSGFRTRNDSTSLRKI